MTARDPLAVSIGAQIRRLRLARGMSQVDAAVAIFDDPTRQGEWSRWERGLRRPNLGSLQQIARYYGEDMEAFGLLPADGPTQADLAEARRLLKRALELLDDRRR